MISKFLVRHFVKDYKNIEDNSVRESYGYLGGFVGIITNSILFAVKLVVGLTINSIAVTADAFNNLSDTVSSIITIVGFKLAGKPADKEHPFGHGRIEYISGLIVSFMVMYVGVEFVKSSFDRIIHPSSVTFKLVPFILILVSIGIKIWLSIFNKYIGKSINSSALEASSLDALSDVISSSCVALSLLLSKWISLPIDGYIGILVSLFILYSGYSLVRETINPLLGQAPDSELIHKIEDAVMNNKYILGVHDLIVHNYGPGRMMASIHAEVPADENIVEVHEVIDQIERDISNDLNLFMVIHIDPLNLNCKILNNTKIEISKILEKFSEIKSFHDFRIVGDGEIQNLIFDIVVDSSKKVKDEEELIRSIRFEVKKLHPLYETIITIDREYT
ncbi:cation diffusion facilitator family transporter [Clostridium sediminicola]|uniref:cation diffusion facilitator family transporter n=1 Tax=Clostridium sediminicola TaxID=3114879 RepID=UPI0031F26B91